VGINFTFSIWSLLFLFDTCFEIVILIWLIWFDFWCLTALSAIFQLDYGELQKRCIPLSWLAAASEKVYQLLAHGRWFSPGTPVSSTNKTDRCEITEILLKVVLNTIIITVTMSQFQLPYDQADCPWSFFNTLSVTHGEWRSSEWTAVGYQR
jgi:hypothetical protein